MTTITLICMRAATLVCKFAITVYIAQFINVEALGFYGLVSSGALLCPVILGFGVSQTVSRDAIHLSEKDYVTQLFFCLVFVVAAYFILIGLFIIIPIFEISAEAQVLVSIIFLFEHIGLDAYQNLTNTGRPVFANVLHFIRGALWVIAYIIASQLNTNLQTIDVLLLFWSAGSLCSALAYWWSLRHLPWGSAVADITSLPRWWTLKAKEAFPLYLGDLAGAFTAQSDRFIVSFVLGLELTGVYVFYQQISSALANLHYTGIIHQARLRFITIAHRQRSILHSEMWKLIRTCAVYSCATGAFAIFFTYATVSYINRDILLSWRFLIIPAMISFILNLFIAAQRLVFFGLKKDVLSMRLSLVASLVGAFNALLFSCLFGLWGSGLAMVLTPLVTVLIHGIAINRESRGWL